MTTLREKGIGWHDPSEKSFGGYYFVGDGQKVFLRKGVAEELNLHFENLAVPLSDGMGLVVAGREDQQTQIQADDPLVFLMIRPNLLELVGIPVDLDVFE